VRARSIPARRALDMTRFAEGLRSAGLDLRHWVSYATVAVVDDATGKPDFTNRNAVVVTPSGAEVDLVLEPSMHPVTARWGWGGGRAHFHCPLEPGDQVIVGFPDGDVSMVPQVLAAVTGASAPMPVGDDGLPLFKNDRVLLHARGVPVEIVTDGGSRVLLEAGGAVQVENKNGTVRIDPDGTVRLHGAGAQEAFLKGSTYRQAEAQLNGEGTGLAGAFAALQAAAVGPLAALQPGFATAHAALLAFEAQASQFLSSAIKGE